MTNQSSTLQGSNSVNVPMTTGTLRAAVPEGWGINRRVDADSVCSVRADIVLIRPVLAAFGRDALQFLLRRGIGIADLHGEMILSDRHAMEVLDNLLANVTSLEAVNWKIVRKAEDRCTNERG